MLGRLARWLRLLGYDTLYFPDIRDSLLLRIAREENRTLLTRDTRLVKVRGLSDYLLLSSNDPFEQLRIVLKTFSLLPSPQDMSGAEGMAGRCSLCNTPTHAASEEEARGHVPAYVLQTARNFRHCASCGRYYWKGSHYEKMRKKLSQILYNVP